MAFEIIETNDLNKEKNKGSLLQGILNCIFLLYAYSGFVFETVKIFYSKIILPEKIISFLISNRANKLIEAQLETQLRQNIENRRDK